MDAIEDGIGRQLGVLSGGVQHVESSNGLRNKSTPKVNGGGLVSAG